MVKILFRFVILFVLSLSHNLSFAQGFSAAALLGVNASQIDGDDSAGYNKVGLTGGFKLFYPVTEKGDLSMELLYSQRGSRSALSLGGGNTFYIKLDYIELPVSFVYKDWYMEDDKYYKVHAEAGLSYGRLFQTGSNISLYEEQPENFVKDDISYLASIAYRFNRNWGFTMRYTRSFRKLFKSEITGLTGLQSYFLTFRGEYHF